MKRRILVPALLMGAGVIAQAHAHDGYYGRGGEGGWQRDGWRHGYDRDDRGWQRGWHRPGYGYYYRAPVVVERPRYYPPPRYYAPPVYALPPPPFVPPVSYPAYPYPAYPYDGGLSLSFTVPLR